MTDISLIITFIPPLIFIETLVVIFGQTSEKSESPVFDPQLSLASDADGLILLLSCHDTGCTKARCAVVRFYCDRGGLDCVRLFLFPLAWLFKAENVLVQELRKFECL